MKTALVALLLSLSSCLLVARPSDIVYKPYCQPINDYVLMCRDGHYGDLWRCTYEFGRWRCRKAVW